jgi:kumamolisin
MTTGRARVVGLLLVAAVVASVGLVTSGGPDRAGAAEPSATCSQPSNVTGFTPQQLAERYGIGDLVAGGADGSGVTVVILEQGQSADLDVLADWEACMGVVGPQFTQTLVGGGSMPAHGNEAQADVEVVAGLVPGADVHVLVSNGSMTSLLQAALDPANTGGHPVDIISSSYGKCEQDAVTDHEVAPGDAVLQQMADQGVWFLKSAGDEGSDDCLPKGTCPPAGGATANVEYPTSNPNVTGVGGTKIDSHTTLGTATVWKQTGADCLAGGGGESILYPRPSFQQGFGPSSVTARMVPDLSGLAGEPTYQIRRVGGWARIIGTSLAAPLYAAGMAAVRSELRARGVAAPASLNEVLYRAAGDPATYATVFDDVVQGDDDLLGVGCCTAGPGYDMASGLGEVHFAAFAGWLVAQDPAPTPGTVPTAPSAGVVVVTPTFTG